MACLPRNQIVQARQPSRFIWHHPLSVPVRSLHHALLFAQSRMKVADQVGASRGVAVAYFRGRNAVGPEEPESLSQFTPAGHDPRVVHEAELNRPNHTLGLMPLAIDVADRKPPTRSNR